MKLLIAPIVVASALTPVAMDHGRYDWATLSWLLAHGLLAAWLWSEDRRATDRRLHAGVIIALGLVLRLVYTYTVPGVTMVRDDAPFVGGLGWVMMQAMVDPSVITAEPMVGGTATPLAHARLWLLLFTAMDGVIMWRLAILLARWGRPRSWLAVYAWSPLLLTSAFGGLRPEIPALFFLISGLTVIAKDGNRRSAFLAFAVAACFSWPAALAAFVVARRRDAIWLLGVIIIPTAAWFMTGLNQDLDWYSARVWPMTLTYITQNDPTIEVFPRLLRPLFDGDLLRYVCLGFWGLGVIGVLLLRQGSTRVALMLCWLGLLACTPDLTGWELAALPFLLVLAPSRTGLLLAALAGIAICVPLDGVGHLAYWGMIVPPVLLLALVEGSAIRRVDGSPGPALNRLDIIIPTMNENIALPGCLDRIDAAVAQLRQDLGDAAPSVTVTIADASDPDAPANPAAARADRLVPCPMRGRGNQFAAAATDSAGDLILMLHADADMQPAALSRLVQAYHRQPGLEWGILGHLYDKRDRGMRLVEASNRLRFHLAGIAFGDQGIFVRRDVLAAIGGVPEIPLMEDVELSLLLADHPCRISLEDQLVVSTRRWEKIGHGAYTRTVLRLVMRYLIQRRLGTDVSDLAGEMYREYYGKAAAPPKA